jgi:DNA (cytosine-5)-methyltransferase 1
MRYPSILPFHEEEWQDHDARIRNHEAAGAKPEYQVVSETVNAADYGVPQIRRRVIVVATRADLPRYKFPVPTHSRTALITAQASGKYWDRHSLSRPTTSEDGRARKSDGLLPWVTVRDAFEDLWDAAESEADADRQHWLIPGAKAYNGHSGSSLDWPSKALKAGVNGVPGGENAVVGDDGRIRYYTFREAARIQTFPDKHVFHGSRKQVTKQIGNAVPCLLAEVLARPLYQIVAGDQPCDHAEAQNA